MCQIGVYFDFMGNPNSTALWIRYEIACLLHNLIEHLLVGARLVSFKLPPLLTTSRHFRSAPPFPADLLSHLILSSHPSAFPPARKRQWPWKGPFSHNFTLRWSSWFILDSNLSVFSSFQSSLCPKPSHAYCDNERGFSFDSSIRTKDTVPVYKNTCSVRVT